MNKIYAGKVELLLKIIPIISQDTEFAIHGGTAINLFVKNLPRYSVDIDLTYIPIKNRQDSLYDINLKLESITEKIKRSLKGVQVSHRKDICKLLCGYQGKQIKIEVNKNKRGIACGDVITMPLCDRGQEEFGLYCEANIVPKKLLYGGKVAAALSRQHPRDLFDVKYMGCSLKSIKEGILFCLLGSDRPIYESLVPNMLDQRDAMKNQFTGMTDRVFTYEEFEETREQLIRGINSVFTEEDKKFIISFEEGIPYWAKSNYKYFQKYPSVQWKLINTLKLKNTNHNKFTEEIKKLKMIIDK